MRIRLSFKTPDVIDYALECFDEDKNLAREMCQKYVKWGEYCDIEINEDENGVVTAKVLEV